MYNKISLIKFIAISESFKLYLNTAEEYYKKESGEEDVAAQAANKGESEIIVAKHRNGAVGPVKLLFQGNITKFKNPIKTDVF